MEIRKIQDRDIDGVVRLWNESCGTEMPISHLPGKVLRRNS